MATLIMEMTLDEPATDESLDAMKDAAETCFEVNDVIRKATYVSPDRKRFICVMEAKDVEAARRSLESAKVPYGTIWPAEII